MTPKIHYTPTGHIPAHYAGNDREPIDEMRDYLGDEAFALHCDATALKYWRRMGRKGDAADDLAKMTWYQRMALHVRTGGQIPDPRSDRPGFAPYERQPLSADVAAWLDSPPGELANVPKSPPDVPTVEAVETFGHWWHLGTEVVFVRVDGDRMAVKFADSSGFHRVDPDDGWLGPVTLRAVRS